MLVLVLTAFSTLWFVSSMVEMLDVLVSRGIPSDVLVTSPAGLREVQSKMEEMDKV